MKPLLKYLTEISQSHHRRIVQSVRKESRQTEVLKTKKILPKICAFSVGATFAGMVVCSGEAFAAVELTPKFEPNNVTAKQPSTLRFTLTNFEGNAANGVSFTNTLPSGLVIANPNGLTNTCNGTPTATAGGNQIQLTGGEVSANGGTCVITVQVKADDAGTYEVSVEPGDVTSTNAGSNEDAARVTLTVAPSSPIDGSIAFNPDLLHGDAGSSVFTLTLNNGNPFDLTGTNFSNITLPSGLAFASSPNGQTTCTGGNITFSGSSFSFAGGTIPADASCTISFNVEPENSNIFQDNTYEIQILSSGIQTTEEITNSSAISGDIRIQSGAKINVSFAESKIFSETTTNMTLELENFNGQDITPLDFTNTLPAGLIPNSIVSSTCGNASVSGQNIVLTGGTIPQAPTGAGSGSCEIVVEVTSNDANSYTNSISAGDFNGVQYQATSANLTVVAPVFIDMSFGPSSVIQGDKTILTYTIRNESTQKNADINQFINTLNLGSGYNLTGVIGSNTCTGSNLNLNGNQITLTGGTIAPESSCQFQVEVEVDETADGGNRNQNVGIGQLDTSLGTNSEESNQTLFVASRVKATKEFSPDSIIQGQQTILTITLHNDFNKDDVNSNPQDAIIDSFLDDLATMGNGFTIGGNVTTTCGGTLNAPQGATEIRMTGGTIPNNGTCTITVPVELNINANIGDRTNTVQVDGLKTQNLGNNIFEAEATLNVPAAIDARPRFNPQKVIINQQSTLEITFSRPSTGNPITGIALNQALPSGYEIAPVPNISADDCGATVTAVPGGNTIDIQNGDLSTKDSCTVSVDVVVPGTVGSDRLRISTGTVTTTQGATNERNRNTTSQRIDPFLTLNKSFTPEEINPRATSKMSIQILNNNPDAIDLSEVQLTDVFPQDLVITDDPQAEFINNSDCTGGTVIAPAGGTQLELTNASIKANATCEVEVNVTSIYAGNLINEIPLENVTTNETVTNRNKPSATLILTGNADLEVVSKDDGKTFVTPGDTTTYTIIIRNNPINSSGDGDDIAGVPIKDIPDPGLTITDWTCVADANSACSEASGTGALDTTVRVAKGETVTFTVNAKVDENIDVEQISELKNTAEVGRVRRVIDPNADNNSKTDTNNVILGSPNVLLVKRITGVKPDEATEYTTTTRDGDSLAGYVNDPANFYDDNKLDYQEPDPNDTQFPTKDTDKWPNTTEDTSSTFLIGGINGGKVLPNEELEYTVYFLSSGEFAAKKVLLCDRVPDKVTFIPDSFNNQPSKAAGGSAISDRGILWLKDGQTQSLTNDSDGDVAQYFPPGVEPSTVYPSIKCGGTNTNGAVVVNLGDLPGANSDGVQLDKTYGFIRFRGRVK
ncbi:MAG: hypothetical protein AAF349_01740 [Cyanobacteria bacterium P01_A01_bin.68]